MAVNLDPPADINAHGGHHPPGRFLDFVGGALATPAATWVHATMCRGINAARIATWLRAAAARPDGRVLLFAGPMPMALRG